MIWYRYLYRATKRVRLKVRYDISEDVIISSKIARAKTSESKKGTTNAQVIYVDFRHYTTL